MTPRERERETFFPAIPPEKSKGKERGKKLPTTEQKKRRKINAVHNNNNTGDIA